VAAPISDSGTPDGSRVGPRVGDGPPVSTPPPRVRPA